MMVNEVTGTELANRLGLPRSLGTRFIEDVLGVKRQIRANGCLGYWAEAQVEEIRQKLIARIARGS